jgi:hypothetical protein
MSINILQYSEIYNDRTTSISGMSQRVLTREELKSLVGLTTVTGVTISGNTYVSLVSDLGSAFYIKDAKLTTNRSGCNLSCSIYNSRLNYRQDVPVSNEGNNYIVDFTALRPDLAQLVEEITFLYKNTSTSGTTVSGLQALTVDYPIDYDYVKFNVAASSYENAPISISNTAIQGLPRNVRVTPAYTGDYDVDRVFVLTASGWEDEDKYHVDRGINLPDYAPWTAGLFENVAVENKCLTLTGTNLSGSWWSPAIYMPDDNYLTMYVYVDNAGTTAGLETEWASINQMLQVRASDETPLPNFLINSWTPQLHTTYKYGVLLPSIEKRTLYPTQQDVYGENDSFWAQDLDVGCGISSDFAWMIPYLRGQSQRIYMKGDGTIIAQQSPGLWEMGARSFWTGFPYKTFGSLNDYWVAATYFLTLSSDYGACYLGSAASADYHRFTLSTLTDNSNWVEGKPYVEHNRSLYPYAMHCHLGGLGVCTFADPIYFEFLGATTLPKPNHPNDWIVIWAEMYPPDTDSDKYMCLYLLNIRNYWVSESKLIGIFGINYKPSDEGYAICACSDADDVEGGFWLHVGYATNIIEKWTGDGIKLHSYVVSRGYNALRESGMGGLWAIRNDGVYYYVENRTNDSLDVQFKIEDDRFEYLQGGDVDASGNLWVVDRDTSTVYRINLSSRAIDYVNYIPYAIGIWPHPTDGSAFVYLSFYSGSATTAIKRVWVNDPYQHEELVTTAPSMPLSDNSGVQFQGKVEANYISPGVNDPVWGNDDSITLQWQGYANSSLSLPTGNYKQFKLTLRRNSSGVTSPKVTKIRIPAPLILNQVPFQGSTPMYINPHLRYDKKTGHYTTNLITWWPHEE